MDRQSQALIRFIVIGGFAFLFARAFWPYVIGILALCGAFYLWNLYLKK